MYIHLFSQQVACFLFYAMTDIQGLCVFLPLSRGKTFSFSPLVLFFLTEHVMVLKSFLSSFNESIQVIIRWKSKMWDVDL